jgi:hypothetical protein
MREILFYFLSVHGRCKKTYDPIAERIEKITFVWPTPGIKAVSTFVSVIYYWDPLIEIRALKRPRGFLNMV